MARVTLYDVRGIPDPVQIWNFGLSIPEVGDNGIDVRCSTTALPGLETDSVLIPLHGFETKYMGRQVYSHQISCTFIETRDMFVHRTFLRWYKMGRDSSNNNFNFKINYEKLAYIDVFDDVGTVIRKIKTWGTYVENINETQLDGSAATAMSVTVLLSFDYYDDMTF